MPTWSTVVRAPLGCILLNSSHAAEAVVEPNLMQKLQLNIQQAALHWKQHAAGDCTLAGRQAASLH